MKRVIIVHGWGGNPDEECLVWLAKELGGKGFEVERPVMPDTMKPKIDSWVSKLKEVAGKVDEETYFIGHSIGNQAIMRYLEQLPENTKVGGAIFIAGWFNLTEEVWDEEYTHEIGDPWVKTPINFEKIKSHTNKIIDVASNNDPYVPLSDTNIFKEKLGAGIIVLNKKGHICDDAGVKELPIVLDKLLEMSK